MSGRHEQSPRTIGVRWLALPVALLIAAATFLVVGSPAGASTTDDAQISVTGLVDDNNPAGGSQLGVHPGDSVKFTASIAPTAKVKSLVKQLGLGGLLDSVTNLLATFQIKADFHTLPGGKAGTVLKGSQSATFHFPHAGTYHFTWTAEKVTLLGAVPIELNGNQLKAAGLELNASNDYVGTIVVAKNPPKGGISVQLPGVKAHPKVGGVQLPTVSIPGVRLPTVAVPDVPNLNPGQGKPGNGSGKTTGSPGPKLTYTPPGLSIPEQVVPGGAGNGNAGGGGGYYNGVLPDGSSQVGNIALPDLSGATNGSGSAKQSNGKSGQKGTVDLASQTAKPSSQLPVVLAIIAIIALALVAGTYARLFLLRKQ